MPYRCAAQPGFDVGDTLLLLVYLGEQLGTRLFHGMVRLGKFFPLELDVVLVILVFLTTAARVGPLVGFFHPGDVGFLDPLLAGQVDLEPVEFQERSLRAPSFSFSLAYWVRSSFTLGPQPDRKTIAAMAMVQYPTAIPIGPRSAHPRRGTRAARRWSWRSNIAFAHHCEKARSGTVIVASSRVCNLTSRLPALRSAGEVPRRKACCIGKSGICLVPNLDEVRFCAPA